MRILLTADPELPVPPNLYGGIERIVDGLNLELRRRGHSTALVAHRDSSSSVDALFPWAYSEHPRGLRNFKQAATLMQAVWKWKPDVVHSFSRLAYLLPVLGLRIPVLMSYQRATGGIRHRCMARLGGSRVHFTGCSNFIAAQGRAAGGQWSAIPNFINPGTFHFQESVPADAPLAFLSRIERIKGAHTAIQIARASGRKLVIAGNRLEHGEGARYWQELVAPEIDGGQVVYVGSVNDEQKDALLGRAAALLVPIEWDEPFGIVFAEALACGTPVISCARGALPEIVRHGVDGFLIGSIAEGVEAVGKIQTLSRAACRERVEKSFSVEGVVLQYEALYRKLAGDRRPYVSPADSYEAVH